MQLLWVLRIPQTDRVLSITGQDHPAPAACRGGPALGKIQPAAAHNDAADSAVPASACAVGGT
jgi:hypothetical protein